MVTLAWLYGPMEPMPAFIPISWRIGPFTTLRHVCEVVLPWREVWLDAASARMTGKYSGRAPAITAFTATFSTVYSQVSRKLPARMRPTTLSGGWLVALSIAATRSSVGSTIGKKSVHRFSMNSWARFSSVSVGRSRGVVRSKVAPARSASSSGWVSPSSTSCMNGRPDTASAPSI